MLVSKRIRSLHWGWQLALWPLYCLAWLMGRVPRAALKLMVMAKRLPPPLFALTLAIVATAALILAFGNALAAQIIGPVMQACAVLAVMYYVARAIINSLRLK